MAFWLSGSGQTIDTSIHVQLNPFLSRIVKCKKNDRTRPILNTTIPESKKGGFRSLSSVCNRNTSLFPRCLLSLDNPLLRNDIMRVPKEENIHCKLRFLGSPVYRRANTEVSCPPKHRATIRNLCWWGKEKTFLMRQQSHTSVSCVLRSSTFLSMSFES